MPLASSRPAEVSSIAMPTRIGPCPGSPVIDIRPPMPWAIWSTPGAARVGAVLAEAGDAAVDDARVDLLHRLVIDAEAVLHVGAVVLDDDVGRLRRASMKISWPSVLFRLSVIARLLRCRFWKSEPSRRLPVASACLARRLDLDDVGAPIGELAHRGRAGAMGGQVEHVNSH